MHFGLFRIKLFNRYPFSLVDSFLIDLSLFMDLFNHFGGGHTYDTDQCDDVMSKAKIITNKTILTFNDPRSKPNIKMS